MDFLEKLRDEMARDIEKAPANIVDGIFESLMRTAKHDFGTKVIMFVFGKERVISFMSKSFSVEDKKKTILSSIRNKNTYPYGMASLMTDHGWVPSDELFEQMKEYIQL